ncbi:MAG: hypothetical protein ACTSVL_05790 [Promethearchaeota archaeon]
MNKYPEWKFSSKRDKHFNKNISGIRTNLLQIQIKKSRMNESGDYCQKNCAKYRFWDKNEINMQFDGFFRVLGKK